MIAKLILWLAVSELTLTSNRSAAAAGTSLSLTASLIIAPEWNRNIQRRMPRYA